MLYYVVYIYVAGLIEAVYSETFVTQQINHNTEFINAFTSSDYIHDNYITNTTIILK